MCMLLFNMCGAVRRSVTIPPNRLHSLVISINWCQSAGNNYNHVNIKQTQPAATFDTRLYKNLKIMTGMWSQIKFEEINS